MDIFFACHNNGLPITTDDSFKQKGHHKFIAKQVSLLQQIGRGRLVFFTLPC
jgi:hypothetical protein